MALNNTIELIEAISAGQMVVLMDDEHRENEGDLVMAASFVDAEDINFMAHYGRGLICLTLQREHCARLNLPLMAGNSYSNYSTNFTVSIDAAKGVTTGISAADRAATIKTAIAPDTKPSDLVQPGHIFPIMANGSGVLSRAGHTEAGCDLAKLAGLLPAAVIVEILNQDGSMARRADLEVFALEHSLKIGTIADLIHYRIGHEKAINRVAEHKISTRYGDFRVIAYLDSTQFNFHLAIVKGDICADKPTLVRVHTQNPVYDLLGILKESSTWSIGKVLQRIADNGSGVVVILYNQFGVEELTDQLNIACESTEGTIGLQAMQGSPEIRVIGLGSQILYDLGVRRMRVLGTPKRFCAISGFGLEIVEYVS